MSDALPVISAQAAATAFAKLGYVVLKKRGKGSHIVMRRADPPSVLTIPNHDPLRRGTLRAAIRKAGLSVSDFRKLL